MLMKMQFNSGIHNPLLVNIYIYCTAIVKNIYQRLHDLASWLLLIVSDLILYSVNLASSDHDNANNPWSTFLTIPVNPVACVRVYVFVCCKRLSSVQFVS